MTYQGGCHCGNIELSLETAVEPEAFEVRACQCSFCRKHSARAISDPEGHLLVKVQDPKALNRYAFGLRTAHFLLCRNCGVYVGALTSDEPLRAIVIVNALEDHERFSAEPVANVFDDETPQSRRARRQAKWTPATIECGGSQPD